jgi:hypothetical protein
LWTATNTLGRSVISQSGNLISLSGSLYVSQSITSSGNISASGNISSSTGWHNTLYVSSSLTASGNISASGTGSFSLLGVGVSTPQNTLDVKGNMAIGGTYGGTNTAPANGLIVQGVVGIGATNPATIAGLSGLTKLDIVGANTDVAARIFSNNAASFAALTMGRTTEDASFGVPGSSGAFVADSTAGELIIKNNNTQAIRIGSGAGTSSLVVTSTSVLCQTSSVGIGSNSPVSKLDVVTTSANAAAKFVGLVGVGAAPATTNPGQVCIVGAGATSTTFPFRFDNVAFDTASSSTGHTFQAWLKVYVANTTGFTDGTTYYIPVYA